MKAVIVIPTYNESQNIEELVATLRKMVTRTEPDILVIDSASPDKTADLVRKMQPSDSRLFLIEQKAKLGLGKAYLEAMEWVLGRDYDVMFMMDADFSHHPKYLNTMLEQIETHDLVVGSRYIPQGGVENWPAYRLALSSFANWYAKMLIGLPFADLTSGFHCFRISLLRKILRYNIHTEGYAFMVELKSLAILQGARFKEIPIIFGNRTRGASKMSKRVIWESVFFVIQRSFQRYRFQKKIRENEAKGSAEKSRVLV